MRPDGEAPGQPPADEVRATAVRWVPPFTTFRFAQVMWLLSMRAGCAMLDRSDGPILSYCASGNRCAIAYQLTLQSAG